MPESPYPPALAGFIGNRVLSEMAKQKGQMALADIKDRREHRTQDAEVVSEVVVVYPPARDSNNKDPLIALLEQIIIDGVVDISIPRPAPPPLGNEPQPTEPDPPELDPCSSMQMSLDSYDMAIAADNAAIDLLQDMLKDATTSEERRSLRAQIKEAKESIKESKEKKKEIKQAMKDMGC